MTVLARVWYQPRTFVSACVVGIDYDRVVHNSTRNSTDPRDFIWLHPAGGGLGGRGMETAPTR
eukprot:6453135-Amphidinium_carterae.1